MRPWPIWKEAGMNSARGCGSWRSRRSSAIRGSGTDTQWTGCSQPGSLPFRFQHGETGVNDGDGLVLAQYVARLRGGFWHSCVSAAGRHLRLYRMARLVGFPPASRRLNDSDRCHVRRALYHSRYRCQSPRWSQLARRIRQVVDVWGDYLDRARSPRRCGGRETERESERTPLPAQRRGARSPAVRARPSLADRAGGSLAERS